MCTHYGVSTAKIYLYQSSKNTSSRPPSGPCSDYNSVQSILVVLGLSYVSRYIPKVHTYIKEVRNLCKILCKISPSK